MFKLDSRACKLGTQIANNGEKHGAKRVAAFTIPIREAMLTEAEVAMLLNRLDVAWLFTSEDPPKPAIPMLGALSVAADFESAQVVLASALSGETIVTLTDCTLTGMTLEPQVGGLTRAAFGVYVRPVIDSAWDALYELLGCEAQIAIGDAKHPAQQGDLALTQPKAAASAPADYAFDASSGAYERHADDGDRDVTQWAFPPKDERRYAPAEAAPPVVNTEAEEDDE